MRAFRVQSREIVELWDVKDQDSCDVACLEFAKAMRQVTLAKLLPADAGGAGRTTTVESGKWTYRVDSTDELGPFMIALHQYIEDEDEHHCFARSTFWVLESIEVGGEG